MAARVLKLGRHLKLEVKITCISLLKSEPIRTALDELAHGRKPQIKPLIMSGDDLQPELHHVPQGLVDLLGDDRGWIALYSIP